MICFEGGNDPRTNSSNMSVITYAVRND